MKHTISSLFFGAFAMSIATAQEKEAIVPDGSERVVEQYGFSPAVRAGDFVFLSGVVAGLPMDEATGEMIPATEANLIAAYERAFAHIAMILGEAGASWEDVVDMTTYHTELVPQLDALITVKNQYTAPPHTAWTAIDVDRLLPDGGITEIKVTAYAPRPRP